MRLLNIDLVDARVVLHHIECAMAEQRLQREDIAAQNLAEAYLYLDDLAAAEQCAQQVIRSHAAHVLPDGLRTLGEIKLAQRDDAAAEAAIQQSIQLAQENNDHYLEAYGLRALLRLHLTQQQRTLAQSVLDQAVSLFESLDMPQEVERTQLTWQNYRGKEE